jgi:hypothetical protein
MAYDDIINFSTFDNTKIKGIDSIKKSLEKQKKLLELNLKFADKI